MTDSNPGRHCVTCSHPARRAIEDALESGRFSIRGTARHFGIDSEALRRHLRNHLDPAVRDALAAVPGLSPLSVADRLLDVANTAHEVRIDARDSGNDALALRAGDAEARSLAVLADRLGVRDGDALTNLADADDIVRAVSKTARRLPDVGRALVEALRLADRPDLAKALETVIPTELEQAE